MVDIRVDLSDRVAKKYRWDGNIVESVGTRLRRVLAQLT